MKHATFRSCACLLALVLALPGLSQERVKFEDVAGWWSADPVWSGESSRIALQLLEKDGKQEARLWLMAIGAYDIPLGELTLQGNVVDFKALSFPLAWDASRTTLSGFLPADAVPLYSIPVEFHRSGPARKPEPRDWRAAPEPKVLWSVETGAPVWAGIERAADGMLYVGNDAGFVYAIDPAGKVRWKFATGGAIRAQPRVVGPLLYIASDSGYLYQLERGSGKEVWRALVDESREPRLPATDEKSRWDRYGSSVVSDGKTLYIASRDKSLRALDRRTGRERWRVVAGDIMTATPALYRDLVLFAAYDGKVQAVARKDGAPRWSYDAKLAVAGDLTVAGDRVLLGSRSYDLIALDARTGAESWKHYYWFSWVESPPVVRDGVVYTGSSDATSVYAIDLADGALRWKTAVPGYSWQRVVVTSDLVITGTLGKGAYPASRNGSLVALDRTSGAIRWIYLDPPSPETVNAKAEWGFAASPALGEGVVYAAGFDGRVFAFECPRAATVLPLIPHGEGLRR